MFKRLLVIVSFCFVISACSPSAVQLTSTSIAAQIQTKTAAPTLTFTPTPTFTPTITQTSTSTSTSTITPTPSPTLWGGYRANQLVAYKSKNQGCYYDGDILVSSLNGANAVNLTIDLPGNKMLGGWSPNGEWIVFGRYSGDGITTDSSNASHLSPIEVWIMRFDGSQKKLLPFTIGPNQIRQISWSLDSEQFLSACLVGKPQYGMCLINTKDFTVKQLDFSGRSPIFSPDGKSYAWLGWEHVGDMADASIYILPEGASTPLPLATPPVESAPNFFSLSMPGIEEIMWMADSRHILFRTLGSIYRTSVDGTNTLHLIAELKRDGNLYSLSPNGRYLLAYMQTPYIIDLTNNKTLSLDWAAYNTGLIWSPDNLLVALKSNKFFVVDLTTGKYNEVKNLDWGSSWSSLRYPTCRVIQP